MSCHVCPNCGTDLRAFEHFRLGDLDIIGNASVYWRAQKIDLTTAETLIVAALARANGAMVKHHAMAEAIGAEASNPSHCVWVHISNIRSKFRKADPAFDQIERAGNEYVRGSRWRVEDVIADLRKATPRQREMHKMLLLNPGLTQPQMMQLMGFRNRNAFTNVLYALRKKGLARRESRHRRAWRAVGSLMMHEELAA